MNSLDDDLLDRVKACRGAEETNDWEEDFLESVEGQLNKGRILSEAQMETLEKIEYKVNFGVESYWEEYGREGRY